MIILFDESRCTRVVEGVLHGLSQIQVANGFTTDLGANPLIFFSFEEADDILDRSLVVTLDLLEYKTVNDVLAKVSIPLEIFLPCKSNSGQAVIDDVHQDIKRALDVPLIVDFKDRNHNSIQYSCAAEALEVISAAATHDSVIAELRLIIDITKKVSTHERAE